MHISLFCSTCNTLKLCQDSMDFINLNSENLFEVLRVEIAKCTLKHCYFSEVEIETFTREMKLSLKIWHSFQVFSISTLHCVKFSES